MHLWLVIFAGDVTFELEEVDFPAMPREGEVLQCSVEHRGDTHEIAAIVGSISWEVGKADDGDELMAMPIIFASVDDPDQLRGMGISPLPADGPSEPRWRARPRINRPRRPRTP